MVGNPTPSSFTIYLSLYIHTNWIQVTFEITLSNITPLNNLLLNSYFENIIVGLPVLYVFNMHAHFMPIKRYLPFEL